ncbi:hypothetical protein [Halalkalibacter akibai]|uniref:Uncharacterized protein n=1 Tax=Halalkalibacter akibai (strain ATCC 43226 / DSM 21942 / CIP 109018 / JCM 9157 / 1139) TaxID=1236973 RepID=W4QZN6_HALA3|nr:hypothetical protein [Halalkalibacter akibai]GAE37367.1 hypothetical protein JCM9157_4642 [Halalkalibacter akibai JCM 9157]
MARIRFNQIYVDSIENSSALLNGKNTPIKWRAIKKTTEGFGSIVGDGNQITNNQHIIFSNKKVQKTTDY